VEAEIDGELAPGECIECDVAAWERAGEVTFVKFAIDCKFQRSPPL
jgi:hypothetical protein